MAPVAAFSMLAAPVAYAASPPVPVISVTLSATGKVAAGQSVTVHASASGSNQPMQYQFWVQSSQAGWQMAQNYSPTTQLPLSLQSGSYVVAVYALSSQNVEAGRFGQAALSTLILNVGSAVTVTGVPNGTQGQGMTVRAQARDLIAPVYQFWIENPQGNWTSSGAYQTGATFTFTPSEPGAYQVIAYAKDPAAPNNALDAVWSQSQHFTVAPQSSAVQGLSTALDNPLAALNNPQALLLGQVAQISAQVLGPGGNPLADVPVVFTATNDSNSDDHVTFPQGLDGEGVTNAAGVAQSTVTVTNPADSTPAELAADPSAVTAVTYQVSVPSDDALTPVSGQILFSAVNELGTSVSGSSGPVITTQSLGAQLINEEYAETQSVGTLQDSPMAVAVEGQFVIPQGAASDSVLTLPISQASGSFGPDADWKSQAVAIPEGFSAASVHVAQLGLSSGSTLTVTFTPTGGQTPYTQVISGPFQQSNFILAIPGQNTGGSLVFQIQSSSEVNAQSASGVTLQSVGLTPQSTPGTTSYAIATSDVAWSQQPVQWTVPSALSASQAQADLGSAYSAADQYQFQVPVYPQVGDGVIDAMSGSAVQASYLVPAANNGLNQNQILSGQTAVPVSPQEIQGSPAIAWGPGGALSAEQAGIATIVGTLRIPGVNYALPPLYSSAAFVPQEPSAQAGNYALAGQQVRVVATVEDSYGNLVPAGTAVVWNIGGSGVQVIQEQKTADASGQADLVISGDGSAQAQISASGNGLAATLNGAGTQSETVQWLPVSLNYTAPGGSAMAVHNSLSTAPVLSLHTGTPYQIGLSVEAGSEPVSGLGVTVTAGSAPATDVSASNGLVEFPVSQQTAGSENVVVALNASPAGAVTIDGKPDIGQGPLSDFARLSIPVQWQSSANAPVFSWTSAPPALAAVGAQPAFTVQLTDAGGNPEAGVPVQFALSGGNASLSAPSVSTNAEGDAQVSISGGSAGEADELTASVAGEPVLASTLHWVAVASGPDGLSPVSVQVNRQVSPNQLSVAFSRNVNSASVLADGSQFAVTDPATGQAYQISSATVQGAMVTLTLAASNPALPSGDPVSVAVAAGMQDGYSAPVEDNYQQTSSAGPVTAFSPSDPALSLQAQNGTLTVSVSNGGADIPDGQSVVVVPQGSVALNSQAAGSVYSTATTAGSSPEVISVPYTASGSASVTVYFDGVEQSLTL